jgi:hypothetical protein
MTIKNLFVKNINRNIETVIKADDRDHISDEVAEYVITKEIATKIQPLFNSYNNYQGANGVWISGFFGSGKSHLLKILSYVFENKNHDGYSCGELFAEKVENDAMLKGDIMAATRIPSESILFNIDQQAQITSKTDPNAILSVFYKVFFDHLGYYGFQPHVAEFEMWLDKQGKYADFKARFEQKHGNSWEKARIDYFDPMVTDNLAETLAEMNDHAAEKYETILDDIENRQKQSIEDFCSRVDDFIKTKASGFRLNFYVDEVGQYISGDSKLMLNIQTLAETLATRTRGKSWIFVTSQEDMEKIVGDMSKNQQNDFSRIQARFKHKIPLTSANVDEVIEKRLLQKDEPAVKLLQDVWKQEHANLSTLLSFSDVGVQFRKYQNQDDFTNKYPFVAYQFSLFQECRRALSSHNAFQGRHQSVGERSMLGVFQQVVTSIEQQKENTIVSFDKMYEGIRNELRGEIQKSIILAERNIDNTFAVQILKTLFMVKYFSNFKTTRRNISVLMIDDMHIDLKAHEKKVDEALNLLENQSYVQRNGDMYEFLTDDEKDIETSIKATDIDDTAVTQMLKEIFFDEIIRDNKIRFLENKQDYDFTSKIDGVMLGREKELEIEIITPNHRDYENNTHHQAHTMGSTCMKIILPQDPVFIKDLKLYLRTIKFIKHNQNTSNRPEVKRILSEKGQMNAARRKTLVDLANKMLTTSTVFMNGSKLEMTASSDGKTFVINAFQHLIRIVYPNLLMIGATIYSEDTVKQVMRKQQPAMFGADEQPPTEAESEILTLVKRRKSMSDRTSLNDIREHFARKPYGWYPNAVWTLIAMLCKRESLNLLQDGDPLDDEAVVTALLNVRHHPNTLTEIKAGDRPEDIRALKKLYAELFDETTTANTGKEIGNAFKDKLSDMAIQVEKLLVNQKEYPFMKLLIPLSDELAKIGKKDYSYFLLNQSDFGEKLLDAKEEFLDPIRKFYHGEQRKIYDAISKVIQGDTSNLDYIEGAELLTLSEVVNSPAPFRGNIIKQAKAALDGLREKVADRITHERNDALVEVNSALQELQQKAEFASLDNTLQKQLTKTFTDEIDRLEKQRYIANIRDIKNGCRQLLTNQLNELMRLVAPKTNENNVKEPLPRYVSRSSIQVNYPKSELNTPEDVEAYAEALKKALLNEIKNNRRIKL